MEGGGDCIISGPVGPICKLIGVQGGREFKLDVWHDKPLEALHDDGGQCHRAVVIEA